MEAITRLLPMLLVVSSAFLLASNRKVGITALGFHSVQSQEICTGKNGGTRTLIPELTRMMENSAKAALGRDGYAQKIHRGGDFIAAANTVCYIGRNFHGKSQDLVGACAECLAVIVPRLSAHCGARVGSQATAVADDNNSPIRMCFAHYEVYL